MSNNTTPSDKKQANPIKGVRKVNLADLQGKLSQRGRARFTDDELLSALKQAVIDGESLIWETAVIESTNEKAQESERQKWRNRAVSVFETLNAENKKIRVQWTSDNQMVITVY